VEAQTSAARFYVLLALACLVIGLFLLAIPTLLVLPEAEFVTASRIGGGLVTAVGAFPSSRYLQRQDRASALRMISLEYERLQAAGLLASPARKELDRMIMSLVRSMVR
jgi:hypothetical protein